MHVQSINKNFEDYECDRAGCEQAVRVELGGEIHYCDFHARELARRIIQALSLSSNAGNLHTQGSEIVSHSLSEAELGERAEAQDELGSNPRQRNIY